MMYINEETGSAVEEMVADWAALIYVDSPFENLLSLVRMSSSIKLVEASYFRFQSRATRV